MVTLLVITTMFVLMRNTFFKIRMSIVNVMAYNSLESKYIFLIKNSTSTNRLKELYSEMQEFYFNCELKKQKDNVRKMLDIIDAKILMSETSFINVGRDESYNLIANCTKCNGHGVLVYNHACTK